MKIVDKVETMNNGLDGLNGSGTISLKVDILRTEDNNYSCRIIFNQHAKFSNKSGSRIGCVYNVMVDFAKYLNELKTSKK